MLIVRENKPMEVNVTTFSDFDTLKLYYWADGGAHELKWHYIFKDSNDLFLRKYINAIDSSIRCYPSPCQSFWIRKGFIPFLVKDLKEIMEEKKIDKIFVEFEHEKHRYSDPYKNKKVCVISNH